MRELDLLSKAHNLIHLEDCAQAIGACSDGKKIGSDSFVGAFSLHPLKNLGVLGDGGFVATHSDAVFEDLLLIRNHGLQNRDTAVTWGFNSRLDAFQAAVANIRLKKLDELNERRVEIANYYRERLVEFLGFQEVSEHSHCVFHNFIARSTRRDEIIEFGCARRRSENSLPETHSLITHRRTAPDPRRSAAQHNRGTGRGDFQFPIFPELTDSKLKW